MTDRERIVQLFFFGFLLLMAYELYQLLSPFLAPIAWAMLLAFLAHPAHVHLRYLLKSRTTSALVITLAVALGVILPSIWLSERLASEAQTLYSGVASLVQDANLKRLVDWLEHSRFAPLLKAVNGHRFNLEQALPKFILQSTQVASHYLLINVTSVAKNLVALVIAFGIVLITFFYLLRDGEEYYDAVRYLAPLHEEDKQVIFETLAATLSAVMRGLLLTAVMQGVVVGFGLLVTGVPYWAFLAIVSAACGLLPIGGTALVWCPAAIYLAYTRGWAPAAVLAGWCILAVLVIDNFIKPLAMGHGTRLPTVALFFGIAGGLEAYGPLGIFAGPALISVFASLLHVYRKTYAGERKRLTTAA